MGVVLLQKCWTSELGGVCVSDFTIGGNVTVKNAVLWDYCLTQCVESLLPLCDVVNVVDSDSEDGTKEILAGLAAKYPKIRLLNYPWPGKLGDIDCILDKMNWSRERLGTHYHLHLEADEVLDPDSMFFIKDAACAPDVVLGMARLNFWGDAQHLLAPGQILSPSVIRFAPTAYWMGGDAPHPKATQTEPAAQWQAAHYCRIYHYGFLRRPEAYLGKFVDLMRNINGSELKDATFFEYLKGCVERGEPWMPKLGFHTLPFPDGHPSSMVSWLAERGYPCTNQKPQDIAS